MNHIPRLHGALTRHLKEMALEKQRHGYFGDGMWSAGRTLGRQEWTEGLGMQSETGKLPDHVCGGAFARRNKRKRGARTRKTGGRTKFRGPSLHTGAQTAPNTRGGNRRVQIDASKVGSGSRVDGRNWYPAATSKNNEYKLDDNSTFRKRTQSKEAREMRAKAAMERMVKATRVKPEIKNDQSSSPQESDTDSDTEAENDSETEHDAEEDEAQYTQGWDETIEQRQRRMARFIEQDAHNADVKNEWADLLNDIVNTDKDSAPMSPSHYEPSVLHTTTEHSDHAERMLDPSRAVCGSSKIGLPHSCRGMKEEVNNHRMEQEPEQEDDIVFVKQHTRQPAKSTSHPTEWSE